MAALVVMGAMITSCNKMEEAGSGHRVNPDGSITYTTTLHMGASTKTVISEGGAHTFKVGDQIAVIYSNGTNTVKATSAALIGKDVDIFNDNRSARFTVTLTEPFAGSEITYVYPASMVKTDGGISYDAFATQDGTLASLAANLDYCRASGSWNGTGDLPTRTLVNQITIGKFTLESGSTPITSSITGMTVSDGTNSYSITPSSLSAIWVAMTPITAGTVTITANTSTVFYTNKNSISGKTLSAGNIYPVNVTMQESNIVDLSKIHSNFTAQDGQTLTGTLGANVKISIADGATVTLDGATINGTDDSNYWWSGLNCLGDATIILADGSENTVKGFDKHRAGIYFLANKTLTIQGSTGRLNVSSNGWAAGIGGSYGDDCGNIRIEGGIITATGSYQCPGIGASSGCGTITITGGSITSTGGTEAPGIGARNCGKITITGGTVTATGGQYGAGIGCKKDGITDGIEIGGTANVTAAGGEKAAGIGSAYCVGRDGTCGNISIGGTATVTATGGSKAAGIGSGYGFDSKSISSCGTITIANTVTSVTATKGADATNSIGKGEGSNSTCGTVTIGSTEGAITESPYTYPTPPPTGAINGRFTINGSGDQVYFSQGNLQAVGTTSSSPSSGWTWQFAEHQWDYIGGRSKDGSEPQTGNNYINGNGSVSTAGTVDLFGWSTEASSNYYGIHNSKDNGTYSDSFKDWGENAITNGGNRINSGWRTLESTEWAYLWNSRDNAANLRTLATVNNVTGLILMPDGWTASGVALTVTTANYTTNNINSTDWNTLEQQGCVFLPAGGYRHGTEIIYAGSYGAYWSSTPTSSDNATSMDFRSSKVEAYNTNRSTGCSVRLVCNAN